jgi:molybdopterin/thiamine biosynthesis adenylyltransferase
MNEDDRRNKESAEKELIARAFSQKGENVWEGKLDIGLRKPIRIRVEFADKFPYELPELFVENLSKQFDQIVPHVNNKGKICIADGSVLLDSERPDRIVVDALCKAQSLLRDGIEGKLDADIGEEFISYLDFDSISYTICNPFAPISKEISLLEFKGFYSNRTSQLFADDLESGKKWLSKMDFDFQNEKKSWFHVLAKPITPPNYKSTYRIKHFFRDLKNNSLSYKDYDRFMTWLKEVGLPVLVLVSIPISETSGTALYGVSLKKPSEKKAKKGGFRGKLPIERELDLILIDPAEQNLIIRFDPEYLLARGGAEVALRKFSIALAGCGAIGSFLAEKFALMGVGNIRLIDNEDLSNDNIHRHVLGVGCIRMNKAQAMKILLERRFPHLSIEYMNDDIIDVLTEEQNFITEADLLCIALGNETLELNINRILKKKMPRMHAWVEPLGIGGHIFVTGLTQGASCFSCLFERDETLVPCNIVSFV